MGFILLAMAFAFPAFFLTAAFSLMTMAAMCTIILTHFIFIAHRFHLQIHNTDAKIGKIRIDWILEVIMIVNNIWKRRGGISLTTKGPNPAPSQVPRYRTDISPFDDFVEN